LPQADPGFQHALEHPIWKKSGVLRAKPPTAWGWFALPWTMPE
jgi:hypothetical protein